MLLLKLQPLPHRFVENPTIVHFWVVIVRHFIMFVARGKHTPKRFKQYHTLCFFYTPKFMSGYLLLFA